MVSKTFIKITNKDIYDMLKEIKDSNDTQHQEIITHQLQTNGKVKLNKWIATTAISLALIMIGILSKHLIDCG